MRACLSLAFGILLTTGCDLALSFDTSRGFEGLSGEKAKLRMEGSWPKAVNAPSVRSMSYRLRGSRDSSSTWYRIELDAEVAERWKDQVHAEAEQHSMDSGVARATYTGFDESTNVLWIYEYTCQHDRMWARGEVPDGVPFEVEPE